MTTTAYDLSRNERIRYVDPAHRQDRRWVLKESLMKYLVAILAVAIGVAGIVYGGADDSPGLQLLGVVFVIGAIAFGVRTVLRSRRTP